MSSRLGVLEIGGSHITGAVVEASSLVVTTTNRLPLNSLGTGPEILAAFADAIRATTAAVDGHWVVALPGPFDHATRAFAAHPAGKFGGVAGLDLAAVVREHAGGQSKITFVNDAVAFGVGEYQAHFGDRRGRLLAITLGTGIGSAFVENGLPLTSDSRIPPAGEIYNLSADSEGTVEDRCAPSALARQAVATVPDFRPTDDFRRLTTLARSGGRQAQQVLDGGMSCLILTLMPWLAAFAPELITWGGSAAKAWDLLAGSISQTLATSCLPFSPRLVHSTDSEFSAIVGAARLALQRSASLGEWEADLDVERSADRKIL